MLTVLHGDALTKLAEVDSESVQTCVTSPPYWGLRDYGTATWEGGDAECDHRKVLDSVIAVATSTLGGGKKTTGHLQEGFKEECGRCGARRIDIQIGLEKTPEEYVSKLVEIFRSVKRVLRKDGTLWLNLGDSYAANGASGLGVKGESSTLVGSANVAHTAQRKTVPVGLKPKDLVGIPWMVAFALRADGWYLRSDIIWSKPNPMPESVTDRPTKSHEYIFLLAKSQKYFFDADAVRDPSQPSSIERMKSGWKGDEMRGFPNGPQNHLSRYIGTKRGMDAAIAGRNIRSVWAIPTSPFTDAHFATFPPDLIKPCILAGAPVGGVVLDPFAGSGTTGKVAIELGRKAILIEPKAEYCEMIERRCKTTIGLPLTA